MSKKVTEPQGNKKHIALSKKEKKQQRIILISLAVLLAVVLGAVIIGLAQPVAKVNGERLGAAEFKKHVRYNRYQLMEQYVQYAQFVQMFGEDSDMGAQFTQSLNQISAQLNPDNATLLGQTVLDQRVRQIILHQEAEKLGISISDAELEEAYNAAFAYYPNGTPTPAPTATAFSTATLSPEQLAIVTLTPTAAPTEIPEEEETEEEAAEEAVVEEEAAEPTPTAEPLPTATAYTEEMFVTEQAAYLERLNKLGLGLTEEDLRTFVYDQLINEAVRDAVTADLPRETEYLWARHILVNDMATAQIVLDSLKQGEDWGELAADLSLDTANKDQGGDLNWFKDGDMVAEFWDAAFALEIGEVSEPVETQFGVHVIQLLGREVRPLDQSSYDQKVTNAFSEWLTEKTEEADIKISDGWDGLIPFEPLYTDENWAILTGQELIPEEETAE